MKRIAIQGVGGAFHDIAARGYFDNEEVETVPCHTFKDVFKAIDKDDNLLGIIAIENTIAGSLLQNHNLLRESASAEGIEAVLAHPQALRHPPWPHPMRSVGWRRRRAPGQPREPAR